MRTTGKWKRRNRKLQNSIQKKNIDGTTINQTSITWSDDLDEREGREKKGIKINVPVRIVRVLRKGVRERQEYVEIALGNVGNGVQDVGFYFKN